MAFAFAFAFAFAVAVAVACDLPATKSEPSTGAKEGAKSRQLFERSAAQRVLATTPLW
jgi:hypothetical protein